MSNRAKYKFTTARDIPVTQRYYTGRQFRSQWLEIQSDGTIIIFKNKHGYSWDGCSPKVVVLDLLLGTPDGAILENTKLPVTWFASLVHDAIYQYKDRVPFTRAEADRLFYFMLKENNFKLARLYYFGVRAGGWLYGKWLNK